MQSRGFTDLNLDIESFLIASPSARANYTLFAKTVAEDVRAANLGTITIEIPPIALVREFLIDPKEIGHIADYVVMMTYDYHYLGSFTTGAVAPIGGAGSTWEFDVETAVKEGVRVIPPEKLILGIPLYGYQWEAISDRAEAATIPSGASTASLRRVQEILRDCPTCKTALDPVALSPYTIFTKDDVINHIYYENEASMQEKINLAKKYNLGGVALWALGYEDDTILRPLEKYKKSFFLIP
jgi:spore germination protein